MTLWNFYTFKVLKVFRKFLRALPSILSLKLWDFFKVFFGVFIVNTRNIALLISVLLKQWRCFCLWGSDTLRNLFSELECTIVFSLVTSAKFENLLFIRSDCNRSPDGSAARILSMWVSQNYQNRCLKQINGLWVLNKSLGKTVPENHVLVEEEVVAHKITEIIFFFIYVFCKIREYPTKYNKTKFNHIRLSRKDNLNAVSNCQMI